MSIGGLRTATDPDEQARAARRAAWVAFAAARLEGHHGYFTASEAATDADRVVAELDARVKDGKL